MIDHESLLYQAWLVIARIGSGVLGGAVVHMGHKSKFFRQYTPRVRLFLIAVISGSSAYFFTDFALTYLNLRSDAAAFIVGAVAVLTAPLIYNFAATNDERSITDFISDWYRGGKKDGK